MTPAVQARTINIEIRNKRIIWRPFLSCEIDPRRRREFKYFATITEKTCLLDVNSLDKALGAWMMGLMQAFQPLFCDQGIDLCR